MARAAAEVAAAQAASQAAAGQASIELAARTASRRQEVERVQRLSAAYNSYVDALNTCLCDTRDNLELYEEACRLYEEGNRLLRHELLAIHVDISQSESVSAIWCPKPRSEPFSSSQHQSTCGRRAVFIGHRVESVRRTY